MKGIRTRAEVCWVFVRNPFLFLEALMAGIIAATIAKAGKDEYCCLSSGGMEVDSAFRIWWDHRLHSLVVGRVGNGK